MESLAGSALQNMSSHVLNEDICLLLSFYTLPLKNQAIFSCCHMLLGVNRLFTITARILARSLDNF